MRIQAHQLTRNFHFNAPNIKNKNHLRLLTNVVSLNELIHWIRIQFYRIQNRVNSAFVILCGTGPIPFWTIMKQLY